MGVTWTEDQKKVIELRERNILVSAAAGSGKTAVLVERIMEMVCDETHPVDVDRLLVVTFTKAAAAEMKERVGAAIRKRLEAQPDNGYLQRQETLVSHAQITTIDSFCSYILRNHFGEIDLDPAFRVADEGELKLLKKDLLKELLEEEYEKKRPEFLRFVECYASGKHDAVLEELILKLYEFSTSDPFPEEWLEHLTLNQGVREMTLVLEHVKHMAESLLLENQQAILLCHGIGGPIFYEEALQQDQQLLTRILESDDYETCSSVIRSRSFATLSRKKMPEGTEEEKKEAVKNARNHMKKVLEGLEKQFFYMPAELIFEAEKIAEPLKKELVSLTLEFSRRFTEKKRKRNIVDFSDMEHLALQILVERKDGECIPTDVAKGYAEYFAEIMIDEYQDSNLVQELILNSISKKAFGGNNLFMVGDVKQSIYRFRQARPELFMEKQETYTLTESTSQRVNLSKNFRSRKEVLDTVNFLFERLMKKELGNVSYDAEAALYLGADMPEADCMQDVKAELLLLDLSEEESEDVSDKVELEAAMIAEKIQNMLKHGKVFDKTTGELRPARLGDMVILLRSMTGWSDTFANVLGAYGIPSVTGSSTGYFSAAEIQTILNFLRILDNQKQDIPLGAVLHSAIGGLESFELAKIRTAYPDIPYHEACIRYAEDGDEAEICKKLQDFWKLCAKLRSMAEYLPIHKLLWEIYDRTSYCQLVRLQPNGAVRAENLQMLVQKALDFESTSYRGLFNFVRYIEHLQKYEVDYGVAESSAGEENAVRIMSIHKSKGLEFPIVFVSGLSKRFNKQDVREKIVMHPELGLGLDAIDPEKRIKFPTLPKKIIQKQIELESLGEELRVLYVALTRAKEKLIMTGTLKNAAEELDMLLKEKEFCQRGAYESLCGGSSYLDWILQASVGENPPFDICKSTLASLVENKVERAIEEGYDYGSLLEKEIEIPKELCERFSYVYPHQKEMEIPGKVSVSELKKQAMEEAVLEMFEEPEIIPYIPAFLREERSISATERGTAYHRVLECMDLADIYHTDQVKERIDHLVQTGMLTEAGALSILPFEIYRFCKSPLCARMLQAEKRGLLYKEQQFMIAKAASEVSKAYESHQTVLVQGIIDAYFEEDGELVLIDYKTDYVKSGAELVARYQKQLQIYGESLEQMTGKRVKEKILYSFCLGQEIEV